MLDTKTNALECGDECLEAGRNPTQLPWYRFATRYVAGKSVLDAGCGLGHGLAILKQVAKEARGQDLDPRLASDDIFVGDLSELPSKSVDVVVSIDVVEHVEDPPEFVGQLVRIAREGIFLSTPNWTASRCQWPYHRREYTPRQFEELLAPWGQVSLFKGTPDGSEAYPVERKRLYYWFNDMRTAGLTALAARCSNHLIPRSWRIHSHNAAWVKVS